MRQRPAILASRSAEYDRAGMARRPEPSVVIDRLPQPTVIAAALAAAIAVLGVAGAIVGTDAFQDEGSIADRLFNLVNEKTIPTFFSGALLAAGGLCALLAAQSRLYGLHRTWLAFAALLLLMALDEVIQIHERIETWTGIDWQQPYAVVLVVAAVVWWRLLRVVDRDSRAMLIGGAVAWVIAFALEDIQYDSNDDRVSGFGAMAISEEILEMIGSTLFLLAVVVALDRIRPRERQ